MPFKQMELIGHFLKTATIIGVPDYELFMVRIIFNYLFINLNTFLSKFIYALLIGCHSKLYTCN